LVRGAFLANGEQVTPTRSLVALSAMLLVIVAAPPAAASVADSTLLPATYDVSANINYGAGTLAVRSSATVTNNTTAPVTQLVFNLVPLRVGHATLGTTTAGAQTATTTVVDQSVIVALPSALEPVQRVTVTIVYSARFATTTTDKNWLFAKLNGTLAAYRWIPWLSAAIPFDRPNFASPFVTAVSADVKVHLTSERRLIYGTSGQLVSTSPDHLTQSFAAKNVRDFNFAADPGYSRLVGWSGATKIIVLYKVLPGSKMLYWAQRALAYYSSKVGPYVYPTLVVAETGGGTGMESPAMVWMSDRYASTRVPYIVAHEVAHQWFYAMLGSNSAVEPFADEALADFLARKLLASFRSSNCSRQRLDGTVWDYTDACYYEVIYIQGGNYLNAYRALVGGSLFWAGMRAYFKIYLFRIGGTRQLWATLDAVSGYAGGHADRFPSYY
jgi:hypothetical protein